MIDKYANELLKHKSKNRHCCYPSVKKPTVIASNSVFAKLKTGTLAMVVLKMVKYD